jgi:hypothetical protein
MHAVSMKKAFEQPDLPAIVRMAAWQAMQGNGYMKPGKWLHELHPLDLVYLINVIDQCKDDPEDPATSLMISLTMILVQAEGLQIDDSAWLNSCVNQLGMFLITESLSRMGMVDVEYGNISFDDSAGDLPIARARS